MGLGRWVVGEGVVCGDVFACLFVFGGEAGGGGGGLDYETRSN